MHYGTVSSLHKTGGHSSNTWPRSSSLSARRPIGSRLQHENFSKRSRMTDAHAELQKELARPDRRPARVLDWLTRALRSAHASSRVRLTAQDVDEGLRILLAAPVKLSVRPGFLMLGGIETIMRDIRRYGEAEHAQMVGRHAEEAKKLGVTVSEAQLAKKARRSPSIQAWERLRTSPILINLIARVWARTFRHSTTFDIRETVKAFELMRSDRAKVPRYAYNVFLHTIVRSVPVLHGDTKMLKRLDRFEMEEIRIRWEQFPENLAEPPRLPHIPGNFEVKQPTTGLGLFQSAWETMRTCVEPNRMSYALALLLETRLATWRAGKLRRAMPDGASSEDPVQASKHMLPWQPVTDVMDKIYQARLLSVEHVNKCMWAALRYDPNLPQSGAAGNIMATEPVVPWPSSQTVLDTYAEMRNNLLQKELDGIRGLDGKKWKSEAHHAMHSLPSLESLLGPSIPHLPRSITPSLPTYELLIRGLANRADLSGALQVLSDMTQTPGSKPSAKGDHRKRTRAIDRNSSFAPSTRTFDAFFQGFCKFGVPSRLVFFDMDNPSKSQWVPRPDTVGLTSEVGGQEPASVDLEQELGKEWNIDALCSVFEMFLSVEPTRRWPGQKVLLDDKTRDLDDSQRNGKHTDGDLASLETAYKDLEDDMSTTSLLYGESGMEASRRVDEAGSGKDWDELDHYRHAVMSRGTSSLGQQSGMRLSQEVEDLFTLTNGPSHSAWAPNQNQLFNVITALRRTSGDDPTWVLAQFARVCAKFGTVDQSEASTVDMHNASVNHQGWTGWRLNERMHRVLGYLYDARDGDATDWKERWRDEVSAVLRQQVDRQGTIAARPAGRHE